MTDPLIVEAQLAARDKEIERLTTESRERLVSLTKAIEENTKLSAEVARLETVLSGVVSTLRGFDKDEANVVEAEWRSAMIKCDHDDITVYLDGSAFCNKCNEILTGSSQQCSYWAMVDKGRTSYPYKEHWRDCDVCQERDPNCAEYRVAPAEKGQ